MKVIGDAAYSEKGNIEYTKENEIKLVAKLNPAVTQGCRKKEDEFEFNQDAGMYVCKAGHMAIRKGRLFLILKSASIVHLGKGVIRKEPKAKLIL